MGCGRGYGNYRSDEQRDGPVFFSERLFIEFLVFIFFCFSGGILGWDPVHTTCILEEMMMML